MDALLARERGRQVRQAVAALPVKYRAPLVLACFHELGYAQIGEILGIERGHVAVLVFRARQRLRRALAAPDGQDDGRTASAGRHPRGAPAAAADGQGP